MTAEIPTFLAHAIALETEAAERYDELAAAMAAHNNPEVAELFRRMRDFSRRHAQSVSRRARGHGLPALKSWEYRWNAPEAPENAPHAGTHYLMTAWHALTFALDNERRGRDFYAQAAAETQDAELRALATEFASEEAEHVDTLETWLLRTPKPPAGWAADPDPPVAAD